MNIPLTPRHNQLLAALPAPDFARLLPFMESIWLPFDKVLHESGDRLHHVYFPTTAIISLRYDMADGRTAEVAAVGNDGLIGIALFLGGDTMPNRAVVLSAGYAYRMKWPILRTEVSRPSGENGAALPLLLLRYMQTLVTQTAQTAVCNRHHSIAQQLCRWLLRTRDRSGSNDLTVTHELIANMLGVRREGITEAAGRLQAAGLIRYRRGHITLLDRSGLEARACACYKVVKREYERLLPCPIEFGV